MTSNEFATGAPSLRISDCGLRILTAGVAPHPQSAIDNPQLEQHRQRILQHLLQRLQERRARRSVDHAMVTAHRQTHAAAHDHPLALRHCLRRDRSDRDDSRLGRVDDRGELIDVEHSEIRNAERRAGVLFGLEAASARLAGEVACLGADLAEALEVGIANHRRDQTVLDRHGHPDVHLVPVADVIVLEPGVAGTMLHERQRDRFNDDVVERNLAALFAELLVQRVARPRGALPLDPRRGGKKGHPRARPRAAGSRFAIVLRICVRGTSSYGVPGAPCAVRRTSGSPGTFSRSRLMTRPPGPEPWTSLRSTPASLAMRRASGDAFTRVASAAIATGAAAGAGAALGCAVGAGAGAGLGAGAGAGFGAAVPGSGLSAPSTFSPGFPIQATTFPTGTVVPSLTSTLSSWPSARATSSMTALSVSTSASVSPDFTASPSCFVHFTRRPSSIVGESASMWTLVAMDGVTRGRGRAERRRRPSRATLSRRARAACCTASARRPESRAAPARRDRRTRRAGSGPPPVRRSPRAASLLRRPPRDSSS